MNNKENTLTWRSLLREIIVDPQERQRIADLLGVNPISLTRWSTGANNPRPKHLYALMAALPARRQQLMTLIAQEYPEFLTDVSVAEELDTTIPIALYTHILEAHNHLPPLLRTSKICMLVLRQILTHFDPQKTGMGVFIALCTPPQPGRKVRSLRIAFSQGNPPWQHFGQVTRFLGIESQSGYTFQSQRSILITEHRQKEIWYPTHYRAPEESTFTYPLLRAGKSAGCLTILSNQPNYFTAAHLELVRQYVELLVLAFGHEYFYNEEQIALGVIPGIHQQKPLLAQFHEKVEHLSIKAMQLHQGVTRPEVEVKVWQELEEEMLKITN